MTQKIKNTFSILPETDASLRELCRLTKRTYQGDMIDWLVEEEMKRRSVNVAELSDYQLVSMVKSGSASE